MTSDAPSDTTSTRRRTPRCRVTRLGLSVAIVTVALAGLVLPISSARAAGRPPDAVVRVEVLGGPIHRVLVDREGRTLYIDIRDHGRHLRCTGQCASLWPPLLLARGASHAMAGPGVRHLGSLMRPDHRLQVTLDGMPLYRYSQDGGPGQIRGQGLRSLFFVATPTGPYRGVTGTGTSGTSGTQGIQPAVHAPGTLTPGPTQPPVAKGTVGGPGASPSPALTGSSPPTTAPSLPTEPSPSPPVTSPPATSPPVTAPPATSPPATAPIGGGVAY